MANIGLEVTNAIAIYDRRRVGYNNPIVILLQNIKYHNIIIIIILCGLWSSQTWMCCVGGSDSCWA